MYIRFLLKKIVAPTLLITKAINGEKMSRLAYLIAVV